MDAYWGWWIAAAVLAGAELVTNTFYLLAIGLAVALGGVAAWFGTSTEVQWAVAAVLGLAFTFVAHRWRTQRLQPAQQPAADIGKSVRVRHWNPDGSARVDYRGTQWTAELATPDTPRAESMVIVGMRGSNLVVADRAH
ncbi:MAG TPA: NfeD family protein [Casimicrobiaceae bacterium]|jgi:membrane protein implicated in regulation of membrane protease activity